MNCKDFKNNFPKILVVSNNSFSDISNNGKTLASFFDNYPVDNIAQLYFSPELPHNSHYKNYFRITDNDILRITLKKSDKCGQVINQEFAGNTKYLPNKYGFLLKKIKKNNLSRIIRETFWASKKWNTDDLNQWLSSFSPDIIFFCAGDSGFAYDITTYIQKKYNSKLVVYITDDYVLPRRTLSPFWWIRRNNILKKMDYSIKHSALFITISSKMRKEYKKLFNKDSILAVNMSKSIRDKTLEEKKDGSFNLVYAGGLHFNRYKTLNLLAKSIKKYNDNPSKIGKAYLKIYSTQNPSKTILKYLNIEDASEYCGGLNNKELKKVLNSCDIPVHVESFDNSSIESTRLSISTKIPEYLSLGKPILAIGPSQVASIKYLEDTAFCITDKSNIYLELIKLLEDENARNELSIKSLMKFNNNHSKEFISTKFTEEILKVFKSN